MPSSWLFVVVLASALSQETLSLVCGPIAVNSPSPLAGKHNSAHTAVSRNPGETTIHFPGAQRNHPMKNSHLKNRYRLPTSPGAVSFPTSDASDNKRFERQRRQLGFFEPQRPQRPQRPNNANRPKNIGGSGAISFPSDPPAWGNSFNSPKPNRPTMTRPQWGQKPPPPPPRPDEDRFMFGSGPPMRTTTKRSRVTPATSRTPANVEVASVTRPTPAPTRPGCNCPSTPEFNPVCGGDRVTYSNAGKLKCANFCGNPVKMMHLGSCITTTTPAPTPPSRVTAPSPRPPTNVREPPQWNWT